MYNKLFAKILDSSIWLESTPTRIVWLTFIAVMDEAGFAQFAAVRNVAHRARVSVEEAQAAIDCLEHPDPESSDPENDGRRIERVPGGWIILNAEKHRALVTRAVIQEQTRERVRRYRERQKNLVTTGVTGNAFPVHVTTSEAEAEAEAEARSESETNTKIPHLKNKPTSEDLAAKGSQPAARSRRPIFAGQRLTVFEWMLDDCTNVLGDYTEAFDLHAWFFDLDALAVKTGLVIPKRDGGAWLQSQLVEEAKQRGLPITMASVPTRDQARTQANIAAFKEFVAKGSS